MKASFKKEAQYKEYGRIFKPGGSLRTVIIFPDTYYLGMSNLGYQVICREFNRHPDVSCERAFLPEDNEVPYSFETRKPLNSFEIIGFSIAFELDYFNIIKTLYRAGIPVKSSERRNEKDPLIIAGGICPSFNPEPLSDIIDLFVIGDGEEVVHEILAKYRSCRAQSRYKILEELSSIDGVYIPSLHSPGSRKNHDEQFKIKRRSVESLDKVDSASAIITPNTEFANTFLIEILRGCFHRCRFCVGSYTQGFKTRSLESTIELCQTEISKKADKIGLIGPCITDHPKIDDICTTLINMGRRISVASLRADSVSETLIDALAFSGTETITLAPESGSERLRKVIGKEISIEKMIDVISLANKKGIDSLKLYFMVGLPTETIADIDKIVEMVKEIKRSVNMKRLTVSISPFVPKPHTPFQWCAMEDTKTLTRKLQYLRQMLMRIGGIRVTGDSARIASMQGMLAKGDRKLSDAMIDSVIHGISWKNVLKRYGLTQGSYIHREIDVNEPLPWDHIEYNVPKKVLIQQYLNSLGS